VRVVVTTIPLGGLHGALAEIEGETVRPRWLVGVEPAQAGTTTASGVSS
jgi:hypothetical protein